MWNTIKDIAAIAGGILGVFNFVQSFWQRSVRLRVGPKLSVRVDGGFLSTSVDLIPEGSVCIEVTNLSSFPVTLAEVGFSPIGGNKGRFVIIPNPRTLLPKG